MLSYAVCGRWRVPFTLCWNVCWRRSTTWWRVSVLDVHKLRSAHLSFVICHLLVGYVAQRCQPDGQLFDDSITGLLDQLIHTSVSVVWPLTSDPWFDQDGRNGRDAKRRTRRFRRINDVAVRNAAMCWSSVSLADVFRRHQVLSECLN